MEHNYLLDNLLWAWRCCWILCPVVGGWWASGGPPGDIPAPGKAPTTGWAVPGTVPATHHSTRTTS